MCEKSNGGELDFCGACASCALVKAGSHPDLHWIAPEEDKQQLSVDQVRVAEPDPRFGNCAHALVVMNPDTAGSGTFKRLKDALARLATDAGWTVEPNTPITAKPDHSLIEAFNCLWHRLSGRLSQRF